MLRTRASGATVRTTFGTELGFVYDKLVTWHDLKKGDLIQNSAGMTWEIEQIKRVTAGLPHFHCVSIDRSARLILFKGGSDRTWDLDYCAPYKVKDHAESSPSYRYQVNQIVQEAGTGRRYLVLAAAGTGDPLYLLASTTLQDNHKLDGTKPKVAEALAMGFTKDMLQTLHESALRPMRNSAGGLVFDHPIHWLSAHFPARRSLQVPENEAALRMSEYQKWQQATYGPPKGYQDWAQAAQKTRGLGLLEQEMRRVQYSNPISPKDAYPKELANGVTPVQPSPTPKLVDISLDIALL